jgi:hypothetical protein
MDPLCRACLFQDLKEAEQMRRLVRHSPAELCILPAGSDATGGMHEIGNCMVVIILADGGDML